MKDQFLNQTFEKYLIFETFLSLKQPQDKYQSKVWVLISKIFQGYTNCMLIVTFTTV